MGQRIADITREPEVLPPVPDPDLVVEVDEGEEKAKPRRRWWRALGPRLLVLVMFTGLAMAVFGNTWSDPTKLALGGGAGDGSIFIWFLRWSAYAIEHGENPFVTTWLNAPDGVSVLWNTSLVLPGVLLAPLTLTLGPVFTFNLVNMAALGLSAWCGYLAILRWVPSHWAAAAGGLLFGFSPAMYAQAHGHVHMTLMFLPPLMLLALDSVLTGRRRRVWVSALLLGIGGAAQLLTGEEVLAFAAVCFTVLVLVLVALFPRRTARRAPRALLGLGIGAATFMALAAWPLWAQLFGEKRVQGDIRPGSRFVSDLLGFVLPTHYQLLAPDSALDVSSRFTGNAAEWNAYVGIPVLLIIAFTTIRWWRAPAVRVSFLTALLIALLSMGQRVHIGGRVTDVPLPWAVVGDIPLLESALAARLMLFAWLPLGLLVAWFLWRVGRHGWPGRAVAAVVMVAALIPLIPASEMNGTPPRIPAFFSSEAVERIPEGSSALMVPFPVPPKAMAMVWQAEAGMRFKQPGGYFIAPDERGRPRFGPPPTEMNGLLVQARNAAEIDGIGQAKRVRLAGELARWQARTIVLGPVGGPPGGQERVRRFLTTMMGRPPEKVEDVEIWFDVDPQKVAAIDDKKKKG